MANSIFAVLFFLITAAAVSGSDFRLLEYWRTVLPHSPMPGAIRQLLRTDKKMTATGIPSEAAGKSVGVAVGGSRRRPVFVNVFPFLYQYAATETQIHADRNASFFFLEKDLLPGAKMNLQFTGSQLDTVFLNRAAASSIPFSTQKLPDILNLLSVDQNSEDAARMKKTLQVCEEPAVGGETRYCATSLEAMVDFATSSLGTRRVLAISTEVNKDDTPKQEYIVDSSCVETLVASKIVACHPLWYAYAVFYCHATRATRAYVASLVGSDGAKVKAAVVCHLDTSSWSPKHLAFHLLQVKPGTVPVCHFLPQDHIIWASGS